ncbi:MAG: DUF1552 domain-containing protein [Vicinamibacterales bacterium]
MVITKIALPRRTVLRGLGAAVTLPFLDAMVPAVRAGAAATPTKRFGAIYMPNGMIVKDFVPAEAGRNYAMTPILTPLEKFRNQMTVVTGLANKPGDPLDAGSGPHSRVSGCWLNGVRVKRTENADLSAGRTADQFAADVLGKDTPLRSLEMALEPNFVVGGCEGGYSCTYINTFSWASATRPLPMETNPAVIFERLFGDGGPGAGRLAGLRRDRSILDSLTGDLARLQKAVGPSDRQVMDEYLDAVRDVERRIQQTGARAAAAVEDMDKPFGIPALFEDHSNLMFDLMALAYRTDMTRVITFQLARELSLRSYPEVGVPEAHHDISHHGNRAENVAKKAKIDTYHMKLVSRLAERLANTPDGDGSLLDHSMILVGGSMGDGNMHSPHNLPVVLLGGAGGAHKPGAHVKAKFDDPFMNLCLTVLDKVDVHLDSIGDSTGRQTI